jgi:hypothetical protein
VVPGGENPYAQVDNSGTLHLVWFWEASPQVKELYYTTFTTPEIVRKEGIKLAEFSVGTGSILYGPVMGFDTKYVYIFWSIERRGGGLSGAGAESSYISFPLKRPSPGIPMQILLPDADRPDYIRYKGAYNYSELAHVPPGIVGSGFIHMPAATRGQRDELAVFLSTEVRRRFEGEIQLAMAIFKGGELFGYQLVAKTGSVSLRPNAVAYGEDLHLTWIDTAGFWRYDVYYASTSPGVKAWLDKRRPRDVLIGAIGILWGILSGIALLPLVLVWGLLPCIFIAIFYIFSAEESLKDKRVKVVLGIAIILYLIVKIVLSPSFLLYIPFLERFPSRLSSFLAFGMQLSILSLALAAMYVYLCRSERPSLLGAFITFVLADAFLSISIYSIGIFGMS